MSFFEALDACPLIASVQASPGSPLADPEILWASARASLDQGIRVLRMEGVESVAAAKSRSRAPVIGLIKKAGAESPVYITPTSAEVEQLLALGCDVIALDATDRPRPSGEELEDLVEMILRGGAVAMGDCDSLASVERAAAAGCQVISTTLAGYTGGAVPSGPDLELLRAAVKRAGRAAVLAEGRYQEPWQVEAALAIGAKGVVVGGALNDPVKLTRRLLGGLPRAEKAGAVDLGGTWLRFAVVSSQREILSLDKTPAPAGRAGRMEWIRERALASGVDRVGIAAGGTVDPATGEVWEAKDFIPDYLGTVWRLPGLECAALNDGLATAWGHAHHPAFAGLRVAALALGTGVGAGLVDRGRLLMGPRGEYPRWNDLALPGGRTVESILGGLTLGQEPGEEQRREAVEACLGLVKAVDRTWLPDAVVVTGGVGLSSWMKEALEEARSGEEGFPSARLFFGPEESGLLGAAALALHPACP